MSDASRNLHVWTEYYDKFTYFSDAKVRPGCHPRILEHRGSTKNSIVLVHGLSDSPYFMSAIGEYFHNELNYNVYMPLLHFHGLKEPHGMEGVELEEWELNVSYALDCAERNSDVVSIGGLSTGGNLSFAIANTRPGINGAVYLFSAALDLAGGPIGLIGDMKEKLLRSFLADVFDINKELIGDNPYRYTHVDMDGAKELARLIKRTDTIIHGFSAKNPFNKYLFAAHSEADTTANIEGIENLFKVCTPTKSHFERFPAKDEIAHASLVLKHSISGITKPEAANPKFSEMMQKIAAFEQKVAVNKAIE
ncbi:alpha/beta hydrolase [Desulfosediminicola flagellatus]|uniref:alpha/beta hydrolase n=1 Tax=Desulfosediminicola flagellatus TaxID=2569541 RepID=UPI0010AB5E97|nr:alpha/beta hydrolase [Desulfosediminicola flagellatus]